MNQLESEPLAIQQALDDHARYLYTITDPAPEDYQQARELLHHDPNRGLRGGDALHLAIAARLGETIYTLDRKLLESATALGIPATNAGIHHKREP